MYYESEETKFIRSKLIVLNELIAIELSKPIELRNEKQLQKFKNKLIIFTAWLKEAGE
jgi:hypothetical protein